MSFGSVSDRGIVILLSLALIVTIISTSVSIYRAAEQGKSIPFLTGAAVSTATGETNLTISSSTSIENQRTIIEFGSGTVNSSCSFCEMDSNGTSVSLYTNLSNLTGPQCCTTWNATQRAGFLLENTGNVNLSVGYTCTGNCTFPLFIGGTRLPGMGGLEIKVTPNSRVRQDGESGSLDTAESCLPGGFFFRHNNASGWNITNSSAYNNGAPGGAGMGKEVYVPLSATGHWLCGNSTEFPLDSDNTKDAAVVDINVTIPATAPATGVKSSFRLTFNGTSSA